jgi:riboflavin kinase
LNIETRNKRSYQLKILRLKGRVFSGKGGGARFVNLAWARKQIEEKIGFAPYPGTLNIRLAGNSMKTKRALTKAVGVEISPAPGYFRGKLFRANVANLGCAVVIPEVPGYPEDVIEVISPVNLREKLHLVDGSLCEFEVTV